MKKLIVVSVIVAVMLLTWGSIVPAHAQDAAKDDKPTFYHLVPGTYVNSWPRFTVYYPKDWVERHPMPQEIFRASAPGPVPSPAFVYSPNVLNAPPLDKWADFVASLFKNMAKDVTVASNKPSRLRDGTPAREFELRMLLNGAPFNAMGLAANKSGLCVNMGVESPTGKIGEDLKAILYSIEFQPDKDEPVRVPSDIREFLDKYSSDMVSHDLAKVMTHYSDRYLKSGTKKGDVERMVKRSIGSVLSFEVGITDFEAAGDKAYLAGFIRVNLGTGMLTAMLGEITIIKENGEWKWYGNQREVVP
jgi:hypothetical protein